ncbi:MAG: glutathione S-transferase, partial [Pseudomonadota bacterium]
MTITVWGRATSSNVQVVMWAVGELGLEYKRIDLGHNYGGT